MSDNIPPFEIQIEILKRVPIKSLMKFRSVSKQWKSIIHSSQFIAEYNNISSHIRPHQLLAGDYKNRKKACIYDDDESFPQHKSSLTLPTSSSDKLCSIIDCSQGLLGIRIHDSIRKYRHVVIWNPSIRKSVAIPLPNCLNSPYQTVIGVGVCNATDPMIVKIKYIGINNINNEQFVNISSIPSHVEVFKLSTGAWRSLSNTPRKSLAFTGEVAVIDKFNYWIATDRTSSVVNSLILSFDMTTEEFSEIYLPVSLATSYCYTLRLSKLRESLAVIESKNEASKREIGVWIKMMEHGIQNSFTKLYTIKLPDALIGVVLGFMKNGQPILSDYSRPRRKLHFYEPESLCFNEAGVSVNEYVWFVGSYIGSLLLLDH